MTDQSLEAIIGMAIQKEEQSHDFYTALQSKVDDPDARDTLAFLAREEIKHKEFLLRYREGGLGPESLRMSHVVDYRIAEHLDAPETRERLEPKEAYVLAAHRELRSFNFYKALADIHPQGSLREMLIRMANEELRHKEKVEYLYSNTAFPQTDGG